MTNEEKNKKIYQLYATLGELSVLRKQNIQKLELIDIEINKFEAELVEVTNAVIEEQSKE